MFCKSCGAPLSDEARFCPVCGSPVPVAEEPEIASEEPVQNDFPTPGSAEPQSAQPDAFYSPAAPAEQSPYAQQPEQPVKPAKKSRLGLIIGIAAAVLVVLGGGLFAYASGVFATPVQKFKMYNTALLDTVTDPIVKAFDDVNEKNVGLDTDITFTASTNIDSYVNEILEDSSLLCQVNAPKAEKGTVGLKLNLMGEETIDAAFRWDEESVGVYVPDVGNSFYTVFFDSIEQLLTDSGMDEAAAEFEAELFEDRDELLPVSGDELRELLDRYEEVLFSSVTAENVLKERGEVELKGIRETVSATTYTFQPTREDVAAVIVNLVDTMKADETVRETLENIFRYTYLSEMYYYTDYQEYLDEMMEDYQDWLDELRDSADELGKTLENEGFYWRISVKGRRLYSVELGTKTAALAYESCGSEKDGREDALVAYEKKHKLDSVLLYSEYTKSGSSISGKVTSDEAELSVRYDCSTKDRSVLGIPYGSFRISVDDVSIRLDTQAAADKHGSEHTLKITNGDEYVKIGFTSTDKKSTVDSYKNVKLTELRDMDDLFALASDFEDWAAELTSDLDDLMW